MACGRPSRCLWRAFTVSTNVSGAAGLPSQYWAVGLDASGLEHCPGIELAHPEAAAALQRLQSRAHRAGMALEVASGYRDYRRQLAIFNAKYQGLRPVFSDTGEQLYRSQFDDAAWLTAILHYSALPGTSRHHWGTDFDVWDSSAVAGDYQLQLQASEYTGDGPFAALSDWLADLIDRDDAEGFFRPYQAHIGAVALEPWHLSHRPTARLFYPQVNEELLRSLWSAGRDDGSVPGSPEPLAGLAALAGQMDVVMERYVRAYYL